MIVIIIIVNVIVIVIIVVVVGDGVEIWGSLLRLGLEVKWWRAVVLLK
jgi:hypothetical protein